MSVAEQRDVPLSPSQRARIRRLSQFKEPAPGEEAGELNIVPYLDIVMNIIVFVIATISVVFMSTIETTPPSSGGNSGTRAMQSQALNLSAWITSEGISLKARGGNVATGCDSLGEGVTVPKGSDGEYDFKELGRCARHLKEENEKFAAETQVTLTANPDVSYQVIIDTIDALRSYRENDSETPLFPDVRFGVAR